MTSLNTSLTKCGTENSYKQTSSKQIPSMTPDEKNNMELLLKRLPELNHYFQLHSKIGKGTFSTVYLATLRDSDSTQKYAVKHLTQACEQSRIYYELKCLQEIGGKDNVVNAEYWLSNDSDCVTFIMPYLPHLKFSDYVVNMDAEETRNYMKNLFIALKRVHSFNIIHRDVKPDNFLYNRETKEFLLVDFGLAQVVRTPNRNVCKTKLPVDENLHADCSKKLKRALNSSEDDEKVSFKANKRIALKLKDSNIMVSSVPRPNMETKMGMEKKKTRVKDDLVSPLKQWIDKQDMNKTPVKSRLFNSTNIPSNSRRKILVEGTSKSPRKHEASRNQLDVFNISTNGSRLAQDSNFTPLLSTKSLTGDLVQMRNSRVIKQQAMSSTSKSDVYLKQMPSTSFTQTCPCSGKSAVCSICESRKSMCAPRAGTSGFRPPEVLFKYLHQTTAVDMWAAGVIMLCILSGCYPFFQSSTDLVSLAEIMTIFGTERTIKVATKFGRRIICSQHSKGVDLKKLCTRLRARSTRNSKGLKSSSSSKSCSSEPKCRDCFQTIRKDGCLCLSEETSNAEPVESEFLSLFPDSAYDLLYRLLDLDPTNRITAAEALEHPFITGL